MGFVWVLFDAAMVSRSNIDTKDRIARLCVQRALAPITAWEVVIFVGVFLLAKQKPGYTSGYEKMKGWKIYIFNHIMGQTLIYREKRTNL